MARGRFLISLFVVFVFSAVSCDAQCGGGKEAGRYRGLVYAVADGDTIDVVFSGEVPEGCEEKERVRLIGVDTPELSPEPQWYAIEARDYTNFYWRKDVEIGFDAISGRRDRYGRLLAYVYLEEGQLLNLLLIREGYGRYYANFAFELTMMTSFAAAEERARSEGKGLWCKE